MKKIEDTEEKTLKMINAMEVLELSQATIARRALNHALITKDEDSALCLFQALRHRASLLPEDSLNIDGYLLNITSLRQLAELSGQEDVAKDLGFLINFFADNTKVLYKILRVLKREHTHDALRENYLNN